MSDTFLHSHILLALIKYTLIFLTIFLPTRKICDKACLFCAQELLNVVF